MSLCRISSKAYVELRKIALGAGSLAAAHAVFDRFDAKCSLLADSPLIGWPRPDSSIGPTTRCLPLDEHIVIYYQPIRGGVRILRIVDGRTKEAGKLRK